MASSFKGRHHTKETKEILRQLAILQWADEEKRAKLLAGRPKKEKDETSYVYGYYYPDGRIFYVGKGKNKRYKDHLRFAKSDKPAEEYCNPYLINICRKIMRNGDKVVIKKIFKGLTEQESFEKEIEQIAYYGKRYDGTGCLVNLTNGGEGPSGRLHTEEWKEWNSKRMKELWGTEEYREKMVYPIGEEHQFYGKHHTEESRQKMSDSLKGREVWNKGIPEDPERIKKLNDAWRGCTHTEEAIEKISETSKEHWEDPEFRRKMEEGRKNSRQITNPLILELKKFFREQGISQREIGEKLGVNLGTVSLWLNEKRGSENGIKKLVKLMEENKKSYEPIDNAVLIELKEFFKKRKITQKSLADRFCVDKKTILLWLNNKNISKIGIRKLIKLMEDIILMENTSG